MRLGQDFCPGILHAVPAKDGLLLRVRIPGGLIDSTQLRTLAHLTANFADRTLEITSRANLQMRAIHPENVPQIAEAIASIGLLPSLLHDRVRNIVSSPIAGFDPEELLDPRPLVRELDRKLSANPTFAQLHPKFSFAIFGGPRRFSHDPDDLTLEAISPTAFRLTIAGTTSAFTAPPAQAIDRILAIAERCIVIAQEFDIPVRTRKLLAIPGALERIVADLAPGLQSPSPKVETRLGTYPTRIVPSIPLGRLTASQAIHLADIADRHQADLRLAPWRGIVLAAIPLDAAPAVIANLQSIGLTCDDRSGFQGISACAGITGCDAALTDVRAHATSLAQLLRNHPSPPNWTVNLSACDKQCARRHAATADLIAEPNGYTLKLRGQIASTAQSPEQAIQATATLHTQLLQEAAAQ